MLQKSEKFYCPTGMQLVVVFMALNNLQHKTQKRNLLMKRQKETRLMQMFENKKGDTKGVNVFLKVQRGCFVDTCGQIQKCFSITHSHKDVTVAKSFVTQATF